MRVPRRPRRTDRPTPPTILRRMSPVRGKNVQISVDVLKAERPDSLDVLWADRQAYLLQLLQRSFDVARVPENDGIDDKTQRPKLVLLSFTVALAQFTALAVEEGTGKTIAALTAVELN